MFKEKTVFILGAGASWHYGYPTGAELVESIIVTASNIKNYLRRLKVELTQMWPPPSNPQMLKERMAPFLFDKSVNGHLIEYGKTLGIYIEKLDELANRLQKINPILIDYFLGENEDLKDVGTLVIAHVILERTLDWKKNPTNINRKPQSRDRIDHRKEDDWYKFIVDRLTRECKDFDELKEKNENQVKFITFNYDMSLEWELYGRLSSIYLYANAKDKMMDFIKGLAIHVYGCCDLLEFNLHDDKDKLQRAYEMSGSIKVIMPEKMEDRKKEHDMVVAREELRDARTVYILGYGFDENNNELLDMKEIFRNSIAKENRKTIYFTNFENNNRINKKAGFVLLNSPNYFLEKSMFGNGLFSCEKSIKNTFDALARDFD